MRQRREHEFDVLKRRIIGCDVLEGFGAHAHSRAPLFVRRSERQRELRMLCNEAAELLPRVPACAEDADPDSIHA